jgi:hypothetical protein
MIVSFTGRLRYYTSYVVGSHHLLVAVPCLIGDDGAERLALWDTGSQWCVLPPELAGGLAPPPPGPDWLRLHTRLGTFDGWVDRILLRLRATEGAQLDVEATWFVSPDWPGPAVIGWKGFMERMRFAMDPSDDALYFAEL